MPSKWIEHVKATQAKEGVTYKQAMKIAKDSYSKDTPASTKLVAAKPVAAKPVAAKPAQTPVKVKKEKAKDVAVVQPPPPVEPVVEVKKVKKLAKKEVSA